MEEEKIKEELNSIRSEMNLLGMDFHHLQGEYFGYDSASITFFMDEVYKKNKWKAYNKFGFKTDDIREILKSLDGFVPSPKILQ